MRCLRAPSELPVFACALASRVHAWARSNGSLTFSTPARASCNAWRTRTTAGFGSSARTVADEGSSGQMSAMSTLRSGLMEESLVELPAGSAEHITLDDQNELPNK